jgi:iron complex outermembrane recepter protein
MYGRLKGGVSIVESTKNVDQRSVPNLLNGLTLPNGKLFSAATLSERADYMRSLMVNNDVGNVARAAGGNYPREFLVFDLNTIKNTFNALELNRAAPQNLPSSFNTVEKVTAMYLQTDLETEVLQRRLRTNFGVRHVKTDVEIDNFQTDGAGGFAPANRVGTYSHTLPSASLAFDVMQDVVLRAAVGKTFKRSSVSAISRTYGVRGSGGDLQVNAGNPELLPEESSSKDWGAEWYFAKGGVVALAGYQKSFTGRLKDGETIMKFNDIGLPRSLFTPNNFVESENPDVRVFLPVNAEAFKIKGLELAYQQTFSFLPAPFDGLGVYGSYTKNQTLGATRTYTGLDGAGNIITATGTVPLVPEDAYSVAAYYERGPLFLRLAYNHKSEWASPDTGSNGYGFQRFNIARGFLDASVGYKFHKSLEVRFDAINLTNTKTYEVFRHFQGRFGDEHSRIENGLQAGRGFALSLRGSF